MPKKLFQDIRVATQIIKSAIEGNKDSGVILNVINIGEIGSNYRDSDAEVKAIEDSDAEVKAIEDSERLRLISDSNSDYVYDKSHDLYDLLDYIISKLDEPKLSNLNKLAINLGLCKFKTKREIAGWLGVSENSIYRAFKKYKN